MRLCVLAAFIAAGLVAAQTPFHGCTVPTGTTTGLYANTTVAACAQQTACITAYTACLGTGTTLNCTRAVECVGARYECMNAAAANTTGCPALTNLYLSIMQVSAGDLWNSSAAYKSCAASACHALNETFSGLGTNCTIDNSLLCKSPVVFVATLLFSGNFTAILANSVQREAFAKAIAHDLSVALKIVGIYVSRMYIAGAKRQAAQTLVVEVQVPGVSSKNAAFQAAFTAVAANPSQFLTTASATYTAATGQTLTVLKVGAGTGSTAFSSIPVPTTAKPATSAPPSPPPTPAPFTNPTTTTSGAVAQSVLAVAVAVLAAMLF